MYALQVHSYKHTSKPQFSSHTNLGKSSLHCNVFCVKIQFAGLFIAAKLTNIAVLLLETKCIFMSNIYYQQISPHVRNFRQSVSQLLYQAGLWFPRFVFMPLRPVSRIIVCQLSWESLSIIFWGKLHCLSVGWDHNGHTDNSVPHWGGRARKRDPDPGSLYTRKLVSVMFYSTFCVTINDVMLQKE